jgi:hypothetical protein
VSGSTYLPGLMARDLAPPRRTVIDENAGQLVADRAEGSVVAPIVSFAGNAAIRSLLVHRSSHEEARVEYRQDHVEGTLEEMDN